MSRRALPVVLACSLLIGCSDGANQGGGDPPTEVEAEVSDDISTVVKVNWRTRGETVGYVEFGRDDELTQSTPITSEPGTKHEATLLGLKPDTEYQFRIVVDDGNGGELGRSSIHTIRTGDLPSGMPPLEVEGDGHDLFTVVPVLGVSTAITILDADGDIVWYQTDDRELDFYRARLSRDGESLIYNAASISGDPADNSELVRVKLDGSESSSVPVPLLAHDFVELDDGTIGAIVVEKRDSEDRTQWGNQIVEIDEDGEVTPVWSTWDCFDPEEEPGDDPNGWTFANALDYDPDEDAYYLGMRSFSSIVKIDRESGECEWVLGLFAGTFDFAQGSERFLHEHQFHVSGNHVLVFDNEGSLENESRVLEYELDFDENVATEVWNYVSDPVVSSFVLGEPTRLDNGDTFINWGAAGQLERVNEDGESIWKLNSDLGYVMGFHTLAESLYPAD